MQVKIRILLAVSLLLFTALAARLVYWQVVSAKGLSAQARSQYDASSIMSAPRGNIMASDGSFWVLRNSVWTVVANTNLTTDAPNVLADALAPILAGSLDDSSAPIAEFERLLNALSKKSAYIPLKHKVSDEVKKNIEALKLKGISFVPQEDRFYPEASAAAQILGFVGKDENGGDIGYFGLEGYYNLPLSGKPGFNGGEKDAKGTPILLDKSTEISAISGIDLITGIDKRIQILAEERLKAGIEKYEAAGGSVTVMNPVSGEVLAMASEPSFDPAEYSRYSDGVFRNPVISDSFEPGSIIKPIVMAAGLDSGVVRPETECDICGEPLKLDKYFIKTWNNVYHPNITMTDVIVDSDNVGMSFVGQKLGADRLYDYFDEFGLGSASGIDLQGEMSPKLRKKGTWNIVDLATASFGQGVAVTGIQMIRAVSVIANGGYLVNPKVVQKIRGDGWEESTKTSPPKRVISAEAAAEAAQMMVEAANRGEAKWAKVPGFFVAGKTGTAQIPVEGHYDATNTNHSFIGFAPATNPKFIMLVTLKSPQSSPWAAETAAPLWYSVAKELFPYLGVQPTE